MIGTIYMGTDPKVPVVKIVNRTRYDTADITAAVLLQCSTSTGRVSDRVEWPHYVVLTEWRGSRAGLIQAQYVSTRLRVIRVAKPEVVDKLKSVVDRVSDMENWRAPSSLLPALVKAIVTHTIGAENGQIGPLELRVHAEHQKPNMAEVEDLMVKEFEAHVATHVLRANQQVEQIRRKFKSRCSWTERTGIDLDKALHEKSRPGVALWLEVMGDERRQDRPEYKIVETDEDYPKRVFSSEVS